MDENINQNNVSKDRIATAKNRVFYANGLGIGKDNPISLHTSSSFVYRITGMDQIVDIIDCGYVRPKECRVKGGHENEVFWSIGGEKTFYYDKRPVLVAPADKVKNGQIGSLSIEDLSAIWFFDEAQKSYINGIGIINQIRQLLTEKNMKNNIDEFLKIRELDRQRFAQLREQQLMNSIFSTLSKEYGIKKVRLLHDIR
ncbi:MAG: hypothetical protein K2M17_00830 [Bacilli bacterium]|nr:hypothetical protein [Bacilli bacterium]